MGIETQVITAALDEVVKVCEAITPLVDGSQTYEPDPGSMQRSSNTYWKPIEQNARVIDGTDLTGVDPDGMLETISTFGAIDGQHTIACHDGRNCGVPGWLGFPKNQTWSKVPRIWPFWIAEMCQEPNLAKMVIIVAFLGRPGAQESGVGQKWSKSRGSWVGEVRRNHIVPKYSDVKNVAFLVD